MTEQSSREPDWEDSPWRAQHRAAPQPSQYPASPYPASPYPTSPYRAVPYPVTGVNPAMRAATADRERTVDVLRAGFTEGRLTQTEYNDRMGRAYEARTYGALQALVSDLPVGPLPGPAMLPQNWQPAPGRNNNSMAVAAMVLGCGEFFTMGLTAIPAVICGHIARGQIKRTGEDGSGMAVTGLVLGYLAIGLFALLVTIAAIAATRSGIATPN
jgi:hypothetical protein